MMHTDPQHIKHLQTMPYEEYLKTSEWKEKRDQILLRDEYRCRACNSNKELHVHHRTYARRGDEDLNDLTTLCDECHEHFHKRMSQQEIMGRTYIPPSPPDEEVTKKWEEYLVGLLLAYPDLVPCITGLLTSDDFEGETVKTLYTALVSDAHSTFPPELQSEIDRLTKLIPAKGEGDVERELMLVMQRVKRLKLLRLNDDLRFRINEAISANDIDGAKKCQSELQAIHRQLRVLAAASSMQ